jgi:Domain of unknown function (DUF4160)
MPQICSFYGILIFMHWNDHNPPHFHAVYGDYEILIRISDLSVYAGSFPSRAFGLLMEWASQHQDELAANWANAQNKTAFKKIEPLR